jgi:hypothetical protein
MVEQGEMIVAWQQRGKHMTAATTQSTHNNRRTGGSGVYKLVRLAARNCALQVNTGSSSLIVKLL